MTKIEEYNDAVLIDGRPIYGVLDDIKVEKNELLYQVNLTVITDDYSNKKYKNYFSDEDKERILKEKPGYKFSD